MTPEQVVAASKGTATLVPQAQRQQIEAIHLETAAEGMHTVDALTLHTHFQFDTQSHGLWCVQYGPQNPVHDDLLKQSLTEQYGAPHVGGLPAIGMQSLA